MTSNASRRPLIAVVGQTASGKTGLAIELAKRHNGEIIAADSRTVYKGMDIGTAKPSLEERAGVPHYGFDLVDVDQRYTAAQFKDYAKALIADIHKRGKLPIIVGGTGLYVDGVLFDYSFGDKVDSAKRSQLDNMSVEELTTYADKKNIVVDSQTAKNKRHLIRLIERGGVTERNTELHYDCLITGIEISKSQLRKRVEARTEAMFRAGLRKEYNDLREKFDLTAPGFSGIGYQEFADWESEKISMSEVKRLIVKNTMSLAKRQATWFKRNKHVQWVSKPEDALALADAFLENKGHE